MRIACAHRFEWIVCDWARSRLGEWLVVVVVEDALVVCTGGGVLPWAFVEQAGWVVTACCGCAVGRVGRGESSRVLPSCVLRAPYSVLGCPSAELGAS